MPCSTGKLCDDVDILRIYLRIMQSAEMCPCPCKTQAKHIAIQVQADVRTIISRDFATRHSLRFPRVERIRYDKSPFDVQTDQQLWDLVNQNKGVVTGEAL